RFAFLSQSGASINYFNLTGFHKLKLSETTAPDDMESFIAHCQEALHAINARGNCMLVMVNFVCTLMEMLNVEEQ
ncbi:MAG: hypothetical protein LBC70_06380, partial [Chitinispirillales bacterium]|nr:hypothetical protein [Chitinispirillales bacterium]